MFKASNSPIFFPPGNSTSSDSSTYDGDKVPFIFAEPELDDSDGHSTETWSTAHQMEVKCWNIYHNCARRHRQIEVLENYGTLDSMTDDDSDDDDDDDDDDSSVQDSEGKRTKQETRQKNAENVNKTNADFLKERPDSASRAKALARRPKNNVDWIESQEDQLWSVSSLSMFHEKEDIAVLANRLSLRRDKHLRWLFRHLVSLPSQQISLDASRTWIVYWITHAIGLLNGWDTATPQQLEYRNRIVPFMLGLQHPSGGYGGGPFQLPHLVSTYAAVAALINVGTDEAFASIDRHGIYNFIRSLRDPMTGGFYVHEDGESDIRAAYCAVTVASILQIVTDDLFEGIEDYIGSLQSFDGGLSGEPGLESHGGYTYCGLVALAILGQACAINLDQLSLWAVSRQSDFCGGFSGRPNKLTDSCYSFWIVGIFSVLTKIGYRSVPLTEDVDLENNSDQSSSPLKNSFQHWFDDVALQLYILACCQESTAETMYRYQGGLRDKPGAASDYYHTCYSLSGLSLSQRQHTSIPLVTRGVGFQPIATGGLGVTNNVLRETDPFYNIDAECVQKARKYFEQIPFKASNGEVGAEGSGVTATL